MKRVFVDSGAFFGHLVADDAAHAAALERFTRARAEGWDLVTTNFVIAETYALLLNRARQGRQLALRLLDAVERGVFRVERVGPEDEARAVALVRRRARRRSLPGLRGGLLPALRRAAEADQRHGRGGV